MFEVVIYAEFSILLLSLGVLYARELRVSTSRNAEFYGFQRRYLVVYAVVMLADWLQGPYLFRLYEEYGYLHSEIAALYITGFATSLTLGPMLGGLADRYGRKRMCLVFCATYSLACVCKFFSSYWVLMLGRVLGGVSTSLLFSSFESWMVSEHNRLGFPSDWLPRTFSLATLVNGVAAVIAGVVANVVAESGGHYRTS